MASPERLSEGRDFHRLVKDCFLSASDGEVQEERAAGVHRSLPGRADLWITYVHDESGDPIAAQILEIKATNWDNIPTSRIRKYVHAQARQVWRYFAHAMDAEDLEGAPTILFPRAPGDAWRRRVVEALFADRCVLVHWWEENETTPAELIECFTEDIDTLAVLRALPARLVPSGPSLPNWICEACRPFGARRVSGIWSTHRHSSPAVTYDRGLGGSDRPESGRAR